jgi:hypothetical protein
VEAMFIKGTLWPSLLQEIMVRRKHFRLRMGQLLVFSECPQFMDLFWFQRAEGSIESLHTEDWFVWPALLCHVGDRRIEWWINWTWLDGRNTEDLKGASIKFMKTYECPKNSSKSFRYIRLRQTGKNRHGSDYLVLTNVEFFGYMTEWMDRIQIS